MTDQPAITPAADRCTRCGEPPAGSWAFTAEWEASHLCIVCLNGPPPKPADPRVTALTLRCGQLREQRDEAIAASERIVARSGEMLDRTKAAAEALEASFRVQIRGLTEQRDEARRERDEALEESEDRWLTVTAARAQAVQATTDAADLRARVEALADQWESDGWPHPASVLRAELWPESTETARVSDSGAGVAPSATPDLLGPQIGAEQ